MVDVAETFLQVFLLETFAKIADRRIFVSLLGSLVLLRTFIFLVTTTRGNLVGLALFNMLILLMLRKPRSLMRTKDLNYSGAKLKFVTKMRFIVKEC
ncbi:hypothetical protein HPP92_015919 [Vanilla planifolia]|uniref:Uncharacterized protein n=1 Tax=Vanilla planifolia TaxID=51239 RepID=A0A835QSI3_VANPL|nr:hypothetical protein HPP92_015919 [Vanilla planifolia]